MYILKANNIRKTFYKFSESIKVLKDISLSIKYGEIVALLGPSGSGKSTLLHIIALLDKPTAGEVFFKKTSFSKSNDSEKDTVRKKGISIIYQQNNLLNDFTALENVFIPLLNNGFTKDEAIKKATKILSTVNLSNRTNHFPSELSGGEQQRVAIARAIITEPDIILADEPTGNLDTENSIMIANILFKYVKEEGSSLIMVTHDPKLADKAKRKIKIKDGKIK